MTQTPRTKSHVDILGICCHKATIRFRKPRTLNLSPPRCFICATIVITAVADVKPDKTGVEIKSTKNPVSGNAKNMLITVSSA